MKFNWGYGIALFYLCFMSVLVYYVIKSTTYDNSLVMENYYEQDLNYQSHLDKLLNAQKMPEAVQVQYNSKNQTVQLIFPKEMEQVEGIIQFFNPLSRHLDVRKSIKLDANQSMQLATKNMPAGRWKIQLDWEHNNLAYYKEVELIW